MLILIIVLLLVLGGGGGYYGHSRWGYGGGAGIGLGTIEGFAIFIFGEKVLVNQLKANQNLLNWIIGITLLITVVIQANKAIKGIF